MDEEVIKLAIESISKEIENSNATKTELANCLKERGRLRMMVNDKEGAMQDLRRAIAYCPEIIDNIQNGAFCGEIRSCK